METYPVLYRLDISQYKTRPIFLNSLNKLGCYITENNHNLCYSPLWENENELYWVCYSDRSSIQCNCTVFRLMRGKKKAFEAQHTAWHNTDSCARSIDGAVELYKRENPFRWEAQQLRDSPKPMERLCPRFANRQCRDWQAVSQHWEPAPHPVFSNHTRLILSERSTKTSLFLLESRTDRGIYFGKDTFGEQDEEKPFSKKGENFMCLWRENIEFECQELNSLIE